MPIYEEKLISPLAVRFTQDYIRSTFRDGRELSLALSQIEERPGVGEYDVVLHAPFPNIEIIRYAPRCRSHPDSADSNTSNSDDDSEHEGEITDSEVKHWFTFDNRRLYCLQKAASALWPRRVATVVEVLYADAGAMKRKYDTSSVGQAVTLGHSFEVIIGRWDWREAILPHSSSEVPAELINSESHAAVVADDAKATVDSLLNAPEEPGMLAAFLSGYECPAEVGSSNSPPPEHCDETACAHLEGSPSSSSEVNDSDDTTDERGAAEDSASNALAAIRRSLSGVWGGLKGEKYHVPLGDSARWMCEREENGRWRKFTMIYDAKNSAIWWGLDRKYYMDPSSLIENPGSMKWYGGRDWGTQRARFTWKKIEEPEVAVAKDSIIGSGHYHSGARNQSWWKRRRAGAGGA